MAGKANANGTNSHAAAFIYIVVVLYILMDSYLQSLQLKLHVFYVPVLYRIVIFYDNGFSFNFSIL